MASVTAARTRSHEPDPLADLGDRRPAVLPAASDPEDAIAALRDALVVFETTGILPRIQEIRQRLASLAG